MKYDEVFCLFFGIDDVVFTSTQIFAVRSMIQDHMKNE